MPIEEIPQILEFSCTLDCMKDVVWNIKYDPKATIGLHVSGNGQDIHCPVELFGDITNFLRSKNIIMPDVLARNVRTPFFAPIESISGKSSLTIPKINGQEDVVSNSLSPPMDPLASFDIGVASPIHTTTPIVENKGIVISPNIEHEVINRPVIRTRVSKNDPQSAEKDAAAIRGSGAAGSIKAVRKKHKVDE